MSSLLDIKWLRTNKKHPVFTSSTPDDPVIDMTNRLKTSDANQLFAVLWSYDIQPLIFTPQLTSGATVTAPTQKQPAYVRLNTTATSGSKALFQTKRFLRYQPYREHELNFSSIFGSDIANRVVRVGQYTNFNGWFFKKSGSTFSVVRRNNSNENTGTIETEVTQPNWNYDKLDGTGPSGLDMFSNLDNTGADGSLNNAIVLYIRYVWHGASGIEWGIEYFNMKVPIHRYIHSAKESKPFARSAILPFKVEVENLAATTAGTFLLGPVSFDVHGGEVNEIGYTRSAKQDNTLKNINSATNFVNLFAVRCKSQINGINNRSVLSLLKYDLYSETNIEYEVLLDCVVTGGSWSDVGSNAISEKNSGSFSYTGGRVVSTGFISAGGKNSAGGVDNNFPQDNFVAIDTVTGNSEAIVIRARKIDGSNNGGAICGLQWKEIY